MEREYQISWGKVVGILVLIVLVIAIIFMVYPKNNINTSTTNTYINNINLMKEAGFEYFVGNNLPDKIGESNKITLDEMVSSNLLLDFKDDSGNYCNKEESYIKVTKSLENEYSMKVFLSCKDNSDYIVTTIMDKECPDCILNNNNNVASNQNSSSSNNSSSNSNIGNNSYSKPGNNTNITYNINYVNNNCSGFNCISNLYYTVSFNSNGGTSVDNQRVRSGETARYVASTRVGYEFLGWYLNGEKYDFNTPVTKKITLIAKWREKQNNQNEYDVCFVTNGGTKLSCQSVIEGDKAFKPSNPTKACYNFDGWYTDSSFKYRYDFNSKVYNDITLYAKWVSNDSCKTKYTVSFNSNGGTNVGSQVVYEGDRAYEPSSPWRSGYKFLGWYYNGNKFNFNTMIYRDYTLVAKWEKEEDKYHTYCKVNRERYFSTSYINGNQTTWNHNWTIRFDKINADDLKITNIGYLNTMTLYNQAYLNQINGKGISMVGGNNKNNILYTSGSMLQNYSLKSNNFNKYLSSPYKVNGLWYTDVSISIRNYNNVDKFYASSLNNYIYFVPFYFDVEYTDKYNCFSDLASNQYKYKNDYNVVNTFYK